MQAFIKCCRCCLDCCHRFIKYVNMHAYCQVALTGENFCEAALSGFSVILKHSGVFAFSLGLGTIFNVLGKLTVSVLNVTIAYCMLKFLPNLYDEINSPIGPLVVVFAFTFLIATLFMGMYTTTATALLHCLFADVDICKQRDIDYLIGSNRPREMRGIVKTLAKPYKQNLFKGKSNISPSSDGTGSP